MKKGLLFLFTLFSFFILTPHILAEEEENKIPDELYTSSIKELQEYSPFLNSQNGNFELRLVRELYHIDDSLIGYYVNIYEDNKLIGFALLSAKPDLGNLLEWGPLENEEDTHYGQILLEKPEQKAYYLSLNNIFFANNLQHLYNKLEKQKRENIEFSEKNDLRSVKYWENMRYGIDIPTVKKELQEFKKESRSSVIKSETIDFTDLGNQDNNFVIRSTTSSSPELSVERVYQRTSGVANPNSSCGPAVGVMIANYYRNVRNYSSVRNSNYYGGTAKHINHMYTMMNSYFFGTNQYSLHNGLETELNLDKNLWIAKSRAYDTPGVEEPSLVNIKNAIDARYPLALLENVNYSNGLRYHWTIIVAYNSSGQIGYYDPDGSISTIKWASWSSISGTRSYTYFALK